MAWYHKRWCSWKYRIFECSKYLNLYIERNIKHKCCIISTSPKWSFDSGSLIKREDVLSELRSQTYLIYSIHSLWISKEYSFIVIIATLIGQKSSRHTKMNLEVIRHRPLTSEEFRTALDPSKRTQTPDGELDVDWLII